MLVLVSGLEIGIGFGLGLGSGHALWETLILEPASTWINSVCTDGFCAQGTGRSALYNEKFRPLASQARLYAQTPHTDEVGLAAA